MVDFSKVKDIEQIEWKYLSYGKTVSALRVVETFERHLDKSGTIFDLGCGGGGLAHFFDHYVGLDRSSLGLATAQATTTGRDSLFVCGDATDMPLKTGCADTILSISMVEHMVDPKAGIEEIYRICKNNGLLIIPCKDTFGFFYDPINFVRQKLGKPPVPRGAFGYGHINLKSKAQWMALIEQSGFTIDAVLPYDDSLLTQIEFFMFSLVTGESEYEDIPIKVLEKSKLRVATLIHKFLSLFDIKTKSSFCQTFVVSKNDRSQQD